MSAHCNNATMNCGDCVICKEFDPHYACPANDKTYWAKRILGMDVPEYEPDMNLSETLEWVDEYKKKYSR